MRISKKGVSYYRDKADELFSQYIRLRDGKCLKCGKTTSLQCSHIEGRRNMRLRFDPMNAITLCAGCHLFWSHKEPRQFVAWLEKNFSKNIQYLDEHKNETEHRKLPEYIELVDSLKKMLSSLKPNE